MGITLIALVITIIVMLILASVAIRLIMGNNGIFNKAKLSKQVNRYTSAKEIVELRLMEIQTKCISEGKEFNIKSIAVGMEESENIIVQYYYETVAKVSNAITPYEETMEIDGILVAVEKYKEYNFLIGKDGKISKVVVGEIPETIEDEKFKDIDEFEEKIMSGKVVVQGVINSPYIMPIDNELKALLKEAKMEITLADVLNTPGIMNTVEGLIPTIEATDVTRSVQNGIITYTRTGGGIIRVPTEYNTTTMASWKAFDGDDTTVTFSSSNCTQAKGYYLEYEFPYEVYALQVSFIQSNGASLAGYRKVIVQAYDETQGDYVDISEYVEQTSNLIFKPVTKNLNYTNAYKIYRIFVKEATSNNTSGDDLSGFAKMQLYGVLKSDINDNSNLFLEKIMQRSSLENITIENMVTNKDFTKRLVNSLSINTIENNSVLMANLPELISAVEASDVTKSTDASGHIVYTRTSGGIIRAASEYTNSYLAWYAFDGKDTSTQTLSKSGQTQNYFIEYEFPEEMYVMNIKYLIATGASATSTRKLITEAFDENVGDFVPISEEASVTGNGTSSGTTHPVVNQYLNYSKAYKRYRVRITQASGQTSYGGFFYIQMYGRNK